MGETGDPRFLPWLVNAMATSDERQRSQIFQAIRRIRDRRAQVTASGKLRPHVSLAARIGPGQRVLRFSVTGETGIVLSRLRATQVIVTEEEKTVANYTLQAEPGPTELHFTIAGPASLVATTDVQPLLRPQDTVRAIAYQDEIRVDSLIEPATGSRDLILVVNGGVCPALPEITAQMEWLCQHDVRVHTILPGEAAIPKLLRLESLARRTGGLALRHDGLTDRCLEQVISSRIQTFEVRYTIRGADVSSVQQVTMQIFTPFGCGEDSTVLVERGD
jgi:hypothetical protein